MGYRKYSLSSFQQDIAEGSSFSRLEIKAKRRWKCYQIMNVAYSLTKIFKARLCSLEKANTIYEDYIRKIHKEIFELRPSRNL